ncbi:hypothetical protein [Halorussus marinus]|uniref:hypothetical protein n=1 Tax=Halorussus marinus TaxID=2505976 RepID=UPI00106E760C|nr:hypothetical protein [Halorussus marinus]
MPSENPLGLSDNEIMAAVQELCQTGETDLLGGGVSTVVLADELGLEQTSVEDRVRYLVERGRLVRVWGARPSPPYRPRQSYLPADMVEDDSTRLSERL